MAVAVDSVRLLVRETVCTMRRVEAVLSMVGVVCVGKVSLSLLCSVAKITKTHLWPRLFKRDFVKEYGKWAVIVGAEDRIGRAYADVFAGRGMNVLLVLLKHHDLDDCIADIKTKHGVEVELLDTSIYTDGLKSDHIRRKFAAKEIGILVNNVNRTDGGEGTSGGGGGGWWQSLAGDMECVSVVESLVLPPMLRRNRGALINVCAPPSTTHPITIPRYHVYSSAKCFVMSYSEVLRHTLRYNSIHVLNVLPSPIPQGIHQFMVPLIHEMNKLVSPHQSVLARESVSALGYTHTTSGYWMHGILGCVLESSPWVLVGVFVLARLTI